jgi:hypothetical protein
VRILVDCLWVEVGVFTFFYYFFSGGRVGSGVRDLSFYTFEIKGLNLASGGAL